MKRGVFMLALVVVVWIGKSCFKDPPVQPEQTNVHTTPYDLQIPPRFPEMKIPSTNPMTQEGVRLGRRLYYDPILDKDSVRSCGQSCHHQAEAFTSAGPVLPHINLGWMEAFLWNGKVEGELEQVMLFEVEDFMQTEVSRLNRHSVYPELFRKAYGVDTIRSISIAKALAQFFRTMISGNSKYDKVMRGEATFTNAQARGYNLFFTETGDCFHCHGPPFFTDNLFHNTGLDPAQTYQQITDKGRGAITGNQEDLGKFKTPPLRNVELTGPYMHDGRFATLEDVLDFYSDSVHYSPTIDPLMRPSQGGLQLSNQQKQDLVAFLKTLTDPHFVQDSSLSNPFQ